MRRNIFILMFLLMPLSFSFPGEEPSDNDYGAYLISNIDKTVSLDLERANLVDVLKMLSQQSGLNFVSTDAVRDRVLTLYLEKAPLSEAMNVIFKANNLSYDYYVSANIFVIKEMGRPTIELKTKVYPLKYIRVDKSRMQFEVLTQLGGSQNEGVSNIVESVQNVLSEFGKVTADPLTNSLVVVDVPVQFSIIDDLIERLDTPQPRVMIGVEMLDVTKSVVDKMGVKFANGLYSSFTGGARNTSFPFPEEYLKGASAQTLSAGTPPLFGIVDLTSLTSIFQLLTTDSTTKILARPKILTISNETAEINLTKDEAIGLSTTTVEGGGTTTEDVERTQTGTRLRVTPQVHLSTKEVTLFVEVFNRDTTDSGLSTSNLTGNIKNPEERGAKSVVRLKHGETLLIGGLIKKKNAKTLTKVPILGDIPFLGAFFRHKDTSGSQDRELLIFLTPRILEDKPLLTQKETIMREQNVSLRRESVKNALDNLSKK